MPQVVFQLRKGSCGVSRFAAVEFDYEHDYEHEHDSQILTLSRRVNRQKGCFSIWRNRT